MRSKIKQACNFHLVLLDIPFSLILFVINIGDGVFLLSNNLVLKMVDILLQKIVTEYSYNSNIAVTKRVKITMYHNIIYQNKISNIWFKDNETTTLNQLTRLSLISYSFTNLSQQKSPYSLRKSAESVYKGHTNIEDMRQRGNLL